MTAGPVRARARLVHTYHGHVFGGYFGPPSTRLFVWIERRLGLRTDIGRAARGSVRERFHATRLVSDIRELYLQLMS